jgi:hypothetical protein
VSGVSKAKYGAGVHGDGYQGVRGKGLHSGFTDEGGTFGVSGFSLNGSGAHGGSIAGFGVEGKKSSEGVGVRGACAEGTGVYGTSTGHEGVHGDSACGTGVLGPGQYGVLWAGPDPSLIGSILCYHSIAQSRPPDAAARIPEPLS